METNLTRPYTASDSIIAFIAEKEAFRAHAYLDIGGVPTIGYGETEGVKMGQTITMESAMLCLQRRVRKTDTYLNKIIKVPLNQNQYDAIVCLVYNIGVGAFTSSTLLKKLNKGDYKGASEQFLVWNKYRDRYTGKLVVSRGLTIRRQEEKQIFDTALDNKTEGEKERGIFEKIKRCLAIKSR